MLDKFKDAVKRGYINMQIITGHILRFKSDPFMDEVQNSAQIIHDGAVAIKDGQIVCVDTKDIVMDRYHGAQIHDFKDHLVTAGFVDAHVHYPQTAMIASWGKRLIDWLNTYTFPEESKFGDPDYANAIAARYLDLGIAHGTTTMASFCTIHPESVDAFFHAASVRNMCVVAGKTCMNRNAPDNLRDTPQTAYDHSKALLEKWHGVGRNHYAITPRFSPTSTPEQLFALGELWAEHPECLMQTHLSEQTDEIDWVKGLFPNARDYLDTYEAFGLLGKNGLYGHAIHLEPREIDRLREIGAAVVHCPTSNTFIGSGLFNMIQLKGRGLRVGLATDTGGGSSFSMLRTMASAYEIGQLRGAALHPAQLLWLATVGSAQCLGLETQIGNITVGQSADIVALNLQSTAAIAQRYATAQDIWEAIFPTIMMGDDRAIAKVWINGKAY